MDSAFGQIAYPLTKDEYKRLIDSDTTLKTMRSIERETVPEKKRKLKESLPVVYYACQYVEGGKRPVLAVAKPSGLCIHDWDHTNVDVREFYLNNIKGREAELGIVVAHVTPSGNGLRLVTEKQKGETIVQCQERFAAMFGMEAFKDEKIKDITRLSFLPSREYFLFINWEGLFDRTMEESANEEAAFPNRESGSADDADAPNQCKSSAEMSADAKVSSKVASSKASADKNAEVETSVVESSSKSFAESMSYDGIKYSRIIEEILNRLATGGKPVEGERNDDLYCLVRELRHITQYNFEYILMLVKPYFSTLKDNEVRKTVNSALNSTGRTITPTLKGILNQLKSENAGDQDSDNKDREWPKMPALPPFMEMVCQHYPKQIRPQVVLAMLPILGTYATHVRFRYLDNEVNSLSFQTAVVGKSGRGKAFATNLYHKLTAKFEAMDQIERKKDQDYQDKLNKRKDKDDYPEDPRAKVRLFSDEITTSMMLEYLDNLESEHGLQFTEEVARLTKAKKSRYGDNDDLYCKAFNNGIGGKESKNRQTRNIRIPIFLNTLFCGTPQSMHNFYNNPEGGLNNRVIYAALPKERSKGIPRYEDFTEEELKQRDEMLEQLWTAGTLEDAQEFKFPYLDKAITKWVNQCDKEDDENPDETWRDLANRSAVMGYRAGALAYFLYGRPTDEKVLKQIVKFALWVATTVRITIYNFCGDEYDKLNEMGNDQPKTRSTKNKKLFSLLPDKFTTKDLVSLRMKNGDSPNVAMIICRWSADGKIRKDADGTYHKLKKVTA